MSREELDALEALARAATGLTTDEAPRVSCRRGADGGADFHFSGPPPESALLAHVAVDSVGIATVTQ